MSVKYKLLQRKNLQNPDAPRKWYANPITVNRLTTRAVCKAVTRGSTLHPAEAETTFNLVCDSVPHELQQGASVQLGSLGWLRLTFGSEGVSELKDFDATSMIRNLRVVFKPSKELMEAVRSGLEFENAGVVEGGFTFPSTRAYMEYKSTGKLPDGTTSGGGGQQGGDTDPLG